MNTKLDAMGWWQADVDVAERAIVAVALLITWYWYVTTRPMRLRGAAAVRLAASVRLAADRPYAIVVAFTFTEMRVTWVSRTGWSPTRYHIGTIVLGTAPRTPSETHTVETALDMFVETVTGDRGRP